MAPAPRTRTVAFVHPADADGRSISTLVLREPSAREYIERGPISKTFKGGGEMPLRAAFDLLAVIRSYLQVVAADPDLDQLLDALSLTDGMRLHRALGSLVSLVSAEDVKLYQTILAFDWHLMSLRDADELPISELFYIAGRLGDHCKRRASEQRKR